MLQIILTTLRLSVPWKFRSQRNIFRLLYFCFSSRPSTGRKKFVVSQLQFDWDKCKRCNYVKSEFNKSYWCHTQSLLNNNNPKLFWTFITSKTKSKSVPPEVVRKRLWKKFVASQLQSDWDKCKRCNYVKSELNKSSWCHTQSLLNNNNPKLFWTFIKSKTKPRSVPPEVFLFDHSVTEGLGKAQLLNKFFTSVFSSRSAVPDDL